MVLLPEIEDTLLHRTILLEAEVLDIQEVVLLVVVVLQPEAEAVADLKAAEVVAVAEAEVAEETKNPNLKLKQLLDNFPEYLIYL